MALRSARHLVALTTASFSLSACVHGAMTSEEAFRVNDRNGCEVECDTELGDYLLQVWDDRFYQGEVVPAYREYRENIPDAAILLLQRARARMLQSRKLGGPSSSVPESCSGKPGCERITMAGPGRSADIEAYCFAGYATNLARLDRRIEEDGLVPAVERAVNGGLIAVDVMDVLGVVSVGRWRLSLNIDDPEAGELAGRDDGLFDLLQVGSALVPLEVTPASAFTAFDVQVGIATRALEAVRKINDKGDSSTCFTRSLEVMLREASRPHRRLVLVSKV